MACCCGSMACSLCSCCTNGKSSTLTRIMYAVMLLVGTIIACITLAPGLQDFLRKVPFCSESQSIAQSVGMGSIDCQAVVGYMAVYRICFGMAAFFLIMAFMMIGVKSSRDNRSAIQNGYVCNRSEALLVNLTTINSITCSRLFAFVQVLTTDRILWHTLVILVTLLLLLFSNHWHNIFNLVNFYAKGFPGYSQMSSCFPVSSYQK